jgi:hypothetical protein
MSRQVIDRFSGRTRTARRYSGATKGGRPVTRLLACLTGLAVVLVGLASAPPASAASSFSISAPSTLRAGERLTVTGNPGRAFAGQIAVLETVGSRPTQFQLQTGTVQQDGRVRLSSAIGLPGTWDVRIRVLQGRSTVARSDVDRVRVSGALLQPTAAEAGSGLRMLAHAQTKAERGRLRPRSSIPAPTGIDPVVAQTLQSLTVVENAISGGIGAPQGPQQQISSGGTLASILTGGLVDWGIGFALNLVVGALFPGGGGPNQTQTQLTQITNQLQQMQAQLSQIQASLSDLQTQVTEEFAQTEATGSDSLCLSLLQQANGYVSDLQVLQQEAQVALDPQWLTTNAAPYANTPAAIRAIGNQMFGSGPGTPSFLSGAIIAQQDVTDLANLLVNDGSPGTPGLVSTCAAAIGGQIIAANPQSVNGNPQLGQVDAAYFTQLQQVVAYYTTWVVIGQVLTAQGGQMAIAQLQPLPLTSAAAVQQVCAGTIAAEPASLLTCPGLLEQIDQTQATVAEAWNLTGGSWGQVTDGLLASDTQINQAAGTFVPAINAWTVDIATYGSASTSTTLPTISSTTAATGPAAATFTPAGAPALSSTSWAGAQLQPASSAAWDHILGVKSLAPYSGATSSAPTACITNQQGSVTSCSATSTLSQLMGQAGLLANGATPSNIIVYTGETSTWNLANSSALGFIYGPDSDQPVIQQQAPTLNVNAFLDSSFVPVQGASVAFGAPGAALTPASLYPYLGTVITTNSAAQYPGAWQFTWSLASPPPLNGYPTAYPVPLISCIPAPPLTTTGLPLTMGQIMGLPNGQTAQVNADRDVGCLNAYLNTMNPIPLTSNPTFYAPINLQYGYDNTGSVAQGAETILASTLPGWVSGSSGPGAGGILAQQPQYIWPITPVANPGCGALTSFSQGVTGTLGVTNTCANLWQEWSAVNTGQPTGPIALTAPITQGTQQVSGANTAGVVLTNSSGESQTATLTVAALSGGVQPQGMLTPVGPNGPLPTGCQPPQGVSAQAPTAPSSSVSCTFIVPPGVSAVNIPVTYGSGASGILTAALSGQGMAAAADISVTNTPAAPAQPPAAVTNLAVSSSTGTSATLTWQVPASTLPITGYTVSIQTPAGSASSQSVPAANVTVAGANASATITLPAQESGYWQFQVLAVSAGGNGLPGSTSSYLGSGPPPAPANLTAVENADGTVSLAWTPITALPPVSGYTVVTTDPSGVPRTPVTVSVPAFTTEALMKTGTWTFSVTAKNTAGSGPAATASSTLLGVAPSAPTNLIITVSDSGWLSATWTAPANAVPAPTSYVLRVYDSGGRAVRNMEIPARGILSTATVPKFFTFGTNSPTGPWTVIAAARNATGLGQSARSIVQVTPGLISGISSTQSVDSSLAQVPMLLEDVDASECRAGFVIESTFGTCSRRVWTLTAK